MLDLISLVCYLLLLTVIVYHFWKYLTQSLEIIPVHIFQENSEFMKHILEQSKCLHNPFRPQVWMSNKHIQSLLTCVMEWGAPGIQFDREYITLDDGEEIAADWVITNTEERKLKDIAVILPGITGDPKGYPSLCHICVKHNLRTVLISKRGYGGSKLKLPKLSGIGSGSDLHPVLKKIRARYPEAKVAGIGYSAGTGVLSGYTAQFGKECLLDVAVGLSPAFQLEKLFTRPTFSWVYEPYMVRRIKNSVILPNLDCLCKAKGVDRKQLLTAKSLHELEENLYAKVNGFETVSDYWKVNDPIHTWGDITIPFMCINSLDDPVCAKDLIPFENFKEHPNTLLITTERGGHCGFYKNLKDVSWSYDVVMDFINIVFKYMDSEKCVNGK